MSCLYSSVKKEKKIVGFQAAETDPVVLANLSRGLVALAASKFFMRLCLALLLPQGEVDCTVTVMAP